MKWKIKQIINKKLPEFTKDWKEIDTYKYKRKWESDNAIYKRFCYTNAILNSVKQKSKAADINYAIHYIRV
jgi:hypothetical protein